MDKQKAEEKKVWIKPKLVVYGDIEKLTTELPVPITNPPGAGGSSGF
jgi:hypothetical protein